MLDELITIGKVSKHQGNKGEVRILPLTDYPDRFELLDRVILVKDEEVKEVDIEKMRYHKQFIILKFVGVDDIGAAIDYKDFFVKIPEEAAILPAESYYFHDILGLKAITKSGRELGEIIDVLETGSNDVYVVDSGEKEYLIPALKEVVEEINLETGQMIINPINGLL
jgi:16S rRNA processing protein RimM